MYYEKLNNNDLELFNRLLDFAWTHALCFEITYHEYEDTWEITMSGAGDGEDFYSGKKISCFADAVEYVINNAEKEYRKLKG